ncbi:MAG: MvaI/BcnI family restriction endonuclease [Acidithiobacillus sp.]
MSQRPPPSSRFVFGRVMELVKEGVIDMPAREFPGTGAPGRLLEYRLGIQENNADSPDLRDWEIKFHGGSSLLTLLHKDPEPRGVVSELVEYYGQPDSLGRLSFRYTVCGASNRRFFVVDRDQRIYVLSREHPDGPSPYWSHNSLMTAFSSKLRRLIVVNGEVLNNPRRVQLVSATAYWEPDINNLVASIVDGTFCIDFDARTKQGPGSSIRNHGTKFRVKEENIHRFYENRRVLG